MQAKDDVQLVGQAKVDSILEAFEAFGDLLAFGGPHYLLADGDSHVVESEPRDVFDVS